MIYDLMSQDAIKQTLRQQLSHIFDEDVEIHDETNLLTLGLESLQVMKLLSQWLKNGYHVSFAHLIKSPTLNDWSAMLSESYIEKAGSSVYMPNIDEREPFDLTDVQYAYWVGRNQNQELGGIGCHGYVEIETSAIDMERLNAAWAKLFQVHPMLRAQYTKDGKQRVLDKPYHPQVIVHDLRHDNHGYQLQRLAELRDKLSHRLMDIENGEVICLQLTLLDEQRALLHFDIDLLVCDVQSFQIILRDLAHYYKYETLPYPSEKWHFAQYLAYQKEKMPDVYDQAEAFWTARLKDLPNGPQLLLVKQPKRIHHPEFKRHTAFVSEEDLAILKKESSNYRVTLPMVLLTAYVRAIAQWSETKAFLMNVPMFDRDPALDLENVVADFTNLLLINVDLNDERSFLEDALRIQQTFHENVEHVQYSGVRVLRELQKQRNSQMKAPVVFSCNIGDPLLTDDFIEVFGDITYMISQTPQVWLDFQAFNKNDGLYMIWDAVEALFPDDLISDIFEYFQEELKMIIQHGINHNKSHVSQSVIRRQQQIEQFNDQYQVTTTLDERFVQCVKHFPNHHALVNGHTAEAMTYQDVYKQAKKVASTLQASGIESGDLVAIYLPRGADVVISILGTMMAGCAYVPIDANQAVHRIEKILKHEGIKAVISKDAMIQKISSHQQYIEYDEAITSSSRFKTMQRSPEDTAYVIFTSGTTGEPKGVEVSHAQAINTIDAINDKCQLNHNDRLLNVSAFDFDLSVYDIFGAFSVGACLYYIDDQHWRDASEWLRIIEQYQITIWNSVPTLMKMLIEEKAALATPNQSLRKVLLSGDWIDVNLPARILNTFSNATIIAMGGATEASIWSNYIDIEGEIPSHWKSIPYGYPLPRQLYRIVNAHGKDCSDYEIGELWIGGQGVAKGYYGDSKLTAEKFVVRDDIKWYRTGDLGRFWRDDTIEFLGRKDNQVSLRGHRIELAEIDTALHQIPGIKNAVTLIDDTHATPQLSSYVTIDFAHIHQNVLINQVTAFKKIQYHDLAVEVAFDTIKHSKEVHQINAFAVNMMKQYLQTTDIQKVTATFQPLIQLWKSWAETASTQQKEIQSDSVLSQVIESFNTPFKAHINSLLYGEKSPADLVLDEKFKGITELIPHFETGQWLNQMLEQMLNHVLTIADAPMEILVYGQNSYDATRSVIHTSQQHWTIAEESLYYIHDLKEKVTEDFEYRILPLDEININEVEKYDVIVLNNVLHRADDVQQTLSHFERYLKPGGLIIFSELTEGTLLQYITTVFLRAHTKSDIQHSYPLLYTEAEWLDVIEASSMKQTHHLTDRYNESGAHLFVLQKDANYSIDKSAIQERLMAYLPQYMVPHHITVVDEIPMTANGKVDRKALMSNAKQDKIEPQLENASRPLTSTETQLAEIWSDILKQDVHLDDDYFELGGDSLLATQLRNKIASHFDIQLTLEHIFKHSKLIEMAHFVDHHLDEESSEILQFSISEDPYAPFPLTDVQQSYLIGRSGVVDFGDVSSHCYFELETDQLNHEILERAWNHLIKKHPSLRTKILADGLSQQVMTTVPYYTIQHENLINEVNREHRLIEIRQEMEHQTFDPYQWPSFDVRYIDVSSNEGRICISFDNLFFDGWSMFALFNQWKEYYENMPDEVEVDKVSFKDYVESFEALKKKETYQRDLEYWENKLAQIHDKPDLNVVNQQTNQTFCRNDYTLDQAAWEKIKQRGQFYGLTAPSILLTVYAEVLSRWSRSPQFTINLTRFHRIPFNEEVNHLIGDFTTLTLLSVDMSVGDYFARRAQRLQETLWEDISHANVSGVTVQRMLNRNQKSQITMPIVFTSGLGINNQDQERIGKVTYGLSQTPQVWMDLQVFEEDGHLRISLDSLKSIFPFGTVDDMFDAYVHVLQLLASNAASWESEQASMIEAPNLSLIMDLNHTKLPAYKDQTLIGLYEAALQRYANNVAIKTSDDELSYDMLNQYANHLANKLKAQGVVKGDIVAILLDKGWRQIVAIIAILKVGAIYLPLNIEHPLKRNQTILDSAKVKSIVMYDDFAEATQYKELYAHTMVENARLEYFATSHVEPNDLAYIIYTSGTTGQPKGVAIRHKSAVNTILDINDRLAVTAEDRTLALSQINFDLSVYDIFGMFFKGASVYIPNANVISNPSELVRILQDESITIWNSVPSFLKLLLQYLASRQGNDTFAIRAIMLSGDWIPVEIKADVQNYIGVCDVFGLGGATEASIWSNIYDISKLPDDATVVPYGRPLKNQKMYILNQQMVHCPNHVVGDLYIAGEGLAHSYWLDDERTANSFIYHPQLAERLYKTGDLAQYSPDGNIIFIGREDGQVKINGFRIEIGEIESQLKSIEAIKDCAIAADNQLIVYYIADGELTSEMLAHHLSEHLPRYMVPNVYNQVDEIPLNDNGKVDRKALLALNHANDVTMINRQHTDTDIEFIQLWSDILQSDDVTLNDDFFRLGGDSLKAMQLIQIIKERLSIHLPIQTIFNYSILGDLSQHIDEVYKLDVEEGEI